jgi:hypothetical protein
MIYLVCFLYVSEYSTSQNTDTIIVVSAVICRIAAFQANNVLVYVRTICQVV